MIGSSDIKFQSQYAEYAMRGFHVIIVTTVFPFTGSQIAALQCQLPPVTVTILF
jgi:hypothetical protein